MRDDRFHTGVKAYESLMSLPPFLWRQCVIEGELTRSQSNLRQRTTFHTNMNNEDIKNNLSLFK